MLLIDICGFACFNSKHSLILKPSLNNLITQRTANHAREGDGDYYCSQIQKIKKTEAVMKLIFKIQWHLGYLKVII